MRSRDEIQDEPRADLLEPWSGDELSILDGPNGWTVTPEGRLCSTVPVLDDVAMSSAFTLAAVLLRVRRRWRHYWRTV